MAVESATVLASDSESVLVLVVVAHESATVLDMGHESGMDSAVSLDTLSASVLFPAARVPLQLRKHSGWQFHHWNGS